MNKSIYSTVLLFSFSILVAVSYQNCGDVGGTSPFDVEDIKTVDGNGAQNNGNYLSLQFTNSPTIQNSVLTANFSCNYTPFSYNSHIVSITVASSSGNYSQSWTTYCSGSNFQISKTLNSSYISTNTHTVTAVLTGIASNGEPVPGGAGATATASIGQGFIYPASTQIFTQDFSSLAEGGSQFRDVVALNSVPQNYYPYTALRGKLEFRVGAAIPLSNTSGISYGILELLPYEIQGTAFPEYSMGVSRYTTQSPVRDFHRLIQGGFTETPQEVPFSGADNRTAFLPNHTYVVDFVIRKNGSFFMKIYDVSAPSVALYLTNRTVNNPLDNFYSDLFGTSRMTIRLGQTSSGTSYHSGFSSVRLYYKVCGYVNSSYDTTCSETAL